jgi:hypothetical protein
MHGQGILIAANFTTEMPEKYFEAQIIFPSALFATNRRRQ